MSGPFHFMTAPFLGFICLGGLLACAQAPPTKEECARKIVEICNLVNQNDYANARLKLAELKAEFPGNRAVDKFSRTMIPLIGVPASTTPPRPRISFFKLSPDDQKLIATIEQSARTAPSMDVLEIVKKFNLRNPDYPHGWIIQAYLALSLNREFEGRAAARNLEELGIGESIDPSMLSLMALLEKKGWLPDSAIASTLPLPPAAPTVPSSAASPGVSDASPALAPVTSAPDASALPTSQQVDAGESELSQVYSDLRGRLDDAQKATLKADELAWIKEKDGIPLDDPRHLQMIEQRIEYLKNWPPPK